MMTEIKKKMNRFGTIVAYFDHTVDNESNMATLNAMKNISSFVDIHHVGSTFEKDYGVNWIGYKVAPPVQRLVGHIIASIRGDGLVVFVKPSTLLKPAVEELYKFTEDARMQRAYGFYIGPMSDPIAVGLTAPLLEHLFHSFPPNLKADDQWIRWVHGWATKTLNGGRYFDATSIFTIKPDPMLTPIEEPIKIESKPAAEHPEPPAGWDASTNSNASAQQLVESDGKAGIELPVVVVEPAKKKPGRPKKA